ncbi:MAG: hypothetical protein AAB400_02030 [Patescibacteria group bacterium]|mgnify:CR=1 FL=1
MNVFKELADEGELTADALRTLQIIDYGAQIKDAMGISVDDVEASETTIVTLLLDDSSSIEHAGNTRVLIDGTNLTLKALKDSKQASGILMHVEALNKGTYSPYVLIDNIAPLTGTTFRPYGNTPLYDKAAIVLGRSLAKKKEFADNNVPTRTITVIITDGADVGSSQHTPATIKHVVDSMLRQEEHLILAMGIDDGQTNFRRIFAEMGIPDACILTPGNSPSEIRKCFQFVSQSAVRASQNAAAFSNIKTGGFSALGGFGT